MFYSIIVPLYNRPDEIRELLESLERQTYTNFEVLVIEDGSTIKGEEEVDKFKEKLDVHYYFKPNSGQGFTRNYGMERAKGDYFIIFDSDCIIPDDYMQIVDRELKEHKYDCYGGPDAALPTFTPVQKAINYAMTSPLTTGGIRGKKKHLGVYHPRSFNLGLSREVFETTKGFPITRMGEDILLSIRILELGFKIGFIEEAKVYHKRRTDLRRYWNQLKFFGRARINIFTYYRSELKLVHFLPAMFLVGIVGGFILSMFNVWIGGAYSVFLMLFTVSVFIHSTFLNGSVHIGLLSIATSYIQLLAYGVGFIQEYTKRVILKRENDVNEYPS